MSGLVRIRFIKDHPSGLKKGREYDVAPGTAKRWVESKFAEYVNGENKAPNESDKKKAGE